MKKNKLKILIGAFFFLGFKFSFSQDVSYNDSCGNFIIKHKVPLIKEYAKYKYLPFYILTPSVEFEFSHFDNKDTFVNLSYHRECEYNSNLKINEINLDLLDNFKYNFSNQNELYSVNINCPDSHTLFNHIVFLATIKTLKQSSIFLNKGVKIPEEISNLKQLEYLNIRYACDNPSFVLDSLRGYYAYNSQKISYADLKVKHYQQNYKIVELPEFLNQLEKLKVLWIDVYDGINVKNNFWEGFNQLEEVIIKADSVYNLRDDFFKNAKIKKVAIGYNYPDYFYRRYKFNSDKLKTNKIPNYLFEVANTLEEFEIYSIDLKKDDLRLAKLKHLKVFNGYISKNMKHLPSAIDSLLKLEKLIVYANSKNYVQKTQLLNLKKLNTIYFEGEHFNKNVCMPPNLNELVITKCHNNLTDLKYISPSVKKLILLDVDLNEVANGIQNHHFEKVFVDLKDLVRLKLEDFEKINTDTLVIQRSNNSVKKRDTKYYEYWRKINRCFKTDTKEYQTWLSEFKKRSTIKVIEVKEWH